MVSVAQADSGYRLPRAKRGKADGVYFRKPGYAKAAAKPKSPQAVVKVISQARGHRAKVLLNYVARNTREFGPEDRLELQDDQGVSIRGPDQIEALYKDWSQDFERAKPGKRAPRHVTHMIFSGQCAQTPENARQVRAVVAELLQEQIGRDGYRYAMVLHTDTPHPHVHVIVNNYHRNQDGPKLRLNPPELLALRTQFAAKLRERGIEQHATRRLDRPQVLAAIAAMEAKGPWYERALQPSAGQRLAPFDALAKRREMARALGKLHQDVRATTLPFSQERRDQLGRLRQLGKDLDRPAPDYKALTADVLLKIERDRERVKDHIRALADPASPVKDQRRLRQRDQAVNRIIASNIDAVRQARADLLRAPGVGVLEAYKLGHQLKTYERELQRIHTQFALGLDAKAAPGTVADVAAARHQAQVIERATKTADKLAALGAWYEPTTGRDNAKTFDAFAKRRALVKIATHLADTLGAAGVAVDHPLTARVDELRAKQIEAPAPDPARLVDNLAKRVDDVRLRADFEARRAAHASTPPDVRASIRAELAKTLTTRADAMRAARREIAEAPGLAERDRAMLAHRLKRMERVFHQAARLTDKPAVLAAKFTTLARPIPAPKIAAPSHSFDPRSVDHDHNPFAVHYGLRDTAGIAWQRPEPYAALDPAGSPAVTLDSVRTLSGRDLDGNAFRGSRLVPDHAPDGLENQRAEHVDGLRRAAYSPGAAGGSVAQGGGEGREGRELIAADPSARFAALLDRVQTGLAAAGRWDDPAPYRSAFAPEGRMPAQALDAFAKQRDMLADIDRLKPEIDGGRITFTPAMRRQLAEIREQRDGIAQAAPRNIEEVVARLAQKVADDQLYIMGKSDKPAATATEALQRRREATRIAERNQASIKSAAAAIEKQAGLSMAQRTALQRRIADMQKAMGAYLGAKGPRLI